MVMFKANFSPFTCSITTSMSVRSRLFSSWLCKLFPHGAHYFFLPLLILYLPKTNNNSLENLVVQDSLSFLPAWWRCSRISIFDWQLRVLQKEEGLPLFTNYQTGICVMSRATTTKTCLFSTHIFMPNNPFFFEVTSSSAELDAKVKCNPPFKRDDAEYYIAKCVSCCSVLYAAWETGAC